MVSSKAVIFDYIGTLVACKSYNMGASREKLFSALTDVGFCANKDKFMEAYREAHEKYRIIRYEQLKEVTNAVWVSEALNAVGYKVEADDSRIRAALNVFFKDYVDSLELRLGAKKLIKKAAGYGKVGLISNFTYAPVVYSSLRQLGIGNFFNAVTVSEANGWRKPSKHIFHDTLNKLQLKPSQAVYVGDSPIEDIKGAKDAGLKTVFIQSQFYRVDDLLVSKQKPEFVFEDLEEILARFEEIVGC